MRSFYLYSYELARISPEELDAAREAFQGRVSTVVADVPSGSIVVPRWRALPFGRELEEEVQRAGSQLINSYREHRMTADIFTWAGLLEGVTAPVYTLEDIPNLPEGEYFVKGETNSIKNNWFTSAYAANKRAILDVVGNLTHDSVTGSQRIAIRPFQRFRKLTEAVDGRPIFNERRMFTYRGEILSEAFYWSSFVDEVGEVKPLVPGSYDSTVNNVLSRLRDHTPFLVVDFAECEDGSWQVVELNDGSMSGLSENDPLTLWTNFVNAVG